MPIIPKGMLKTLGFIASTDPFTPSSSPGETPLIYGLGKSKTFQKEQKLSGNTHTKLIQEGN